MCPPKSTGDLAWCSSDARTITTQTSLQSCARLQVVLVGSRHGPAALRLWDVEQEEVQILPWTNIYTRSGCGGGGAEERGGTEERAGAEEGGGAKEEAGAEAGSCSGAEHY